MKASFQQERVGIPLEDFAAGNFSIDQGVPVVPQAVPLGALSPGQPVAQQPFEAPVQQAIIPPVQPTGFGGGQPISLDEADIFLRQQQAQEQAQQEKGFLGRAAEGITQAFVGQQEEDLPEIGRASPEELGIGSLDTLKIAGGFFLEPTQEGKAEILRQNVPGVQFERDKFDNLIATVGEKRFFLNEPGFSQQDVLDLGSEIAKFAPGAGIAGGLARGTSGLVSAGAQVLGGTASSGGTQELAQLFGSERATDIGEAILAGVFAGAGQIAAPFVGKVVKKIFGGKKLNPEEITQLTDAGIDPASLAPENIRSFVATRGAPTAERLATAEAQVLPEAIPLVREAEKGFIETARKGRGGAGSEELQATVRKFDERQAVAIQDNIDRIAENLGDPTRIPKSPAEIGDALADKLENIAIVKGDQVRDAYKSAQDLGASFPVRIVDDIGDNFTSFIDNVQLDELNPKVISFQNRLVKLQETIRARPENITANISDVENLRKFVNANIFSIDKTDRLIARGAKKAIDDVQQNFIDGALLSGSPKALAELKRARKLSSEFKNVFENKHNIVTSLTEKTGFGEQAILKVDPDDAINAIFGKAATGTKGIAKRVKQIKKIIPEKDFDSLRQAHFLQMINRSKRGETFSPAKGKAAWNEIRRDRPELIKSLYDKNQIKTIDRFFKVADIAKRKGIDENVSNSGIKVARELREFFGAPGAFAGGFLKNILSPGLKATDKLRLERALEGALPVSQAVPALTTATGAQLGAETARELQQ